MTVIPSLSYLKIVRALERAVDLTMQRVYVLKSVRLSHASILLSAANRPVEPRRALEPVLRKQCAEGLNPEYGRSWH